MVRKVSISLPEHVYMALERRATRRGLNVYQYIKEILVAVAELDAEEECKMRVEWARERLRELLG